MKGIKYLNYLGYLMITLLLVTLLCIKAPELFGYKAYCILSDSMEPAIQTGAAVYVEPAEMEDIEPGDCITFGMGTHTQLTATHRAVTVDLENREITTKGDNNPAEDSMKVNDNMLIGKVVLEIPLLGYVFSFLQTAAGKIYCVVTFVLVLIGGNGKKKK